MTYLKHFATGDYSLPSQILQSRGLYRDTFGFRKLLIFVTPKKLLALNTGEKGAVVWSRYFGNVITKLDQIHVVRTALVKYPPIIVAIGIENEHQVNHLLYYAQMIISLFN